MSVFSNLFKGLTAGIVKQALAKQVDEFKAALAEEQKYQTVVAWAIKTNNTAALADIGNVAVEWIEDTGAEIGQFVPQVTAAIDGLLIGNVPAIDPWERDRLSNEALWSKYGALATAK